MGQVAALATPNRANCPVMGPRHVCTGASRGEAAHRLSYCRSFSPRPVDINDGLDMIIELRGKEVHVAVVALHSDRRIYHLVAGDHRAHVIFAESKPAAHALIHCFRGCHLQNPLLVLGAVH